MAGEVWLGEVGRGRVRFGTAGGARLGVSGHGTARSGMAGKVRLGVASTARRGWQARRGQVWQG